MKRPLATLCMCMALAVSCNLAVAGGNHWFALERKAKRVAEWQESQDKRFKILETERVKWLKNVDAARKLVKPAR